MKIWQKLSLNYHQLSSNTHLISSTAWCNYDCCQIRRKGAGKPIFPTLKDLEADLGSRAGVSQSYCPKCYPDDMSFVVRKPLFRVSDLVGHKPDCAVTEDG